MFSLESWHFSILFMLLILVCSCSLQCRCLLFILRKNKVIPCFLTLHSVIWVSLSDYFHDFSSLAIHKNVCVLLFADLHHTNHISVCLMTCLLTSDNKLFQVWYTCEHERTWVAVMYQTYIWYFNLFWNIFWKSWGFRWNWMLCEKNDAPVMKSLYASQFCFIELKYYHSMQCFNCRK
jgi:hypothetical protein